MFVAIKGENFDGHDFVSQAEEKGAGLLMVSKTVDSRLPFVMVNDTRLAQLKLAEYYRKKFNIPVVGITGSVGKTTTKEMVSAALGQKFNVLKTQGNFNNDIGLPKMIFQLNEAYTAAVFEMGMSHLGEISLLTRAARPTVSVISNIGVSHIENLGSKENILKAKLEILEGMDENAPLILNGDDILLRNSDIKNRKVIYYGIQNRRCDYYAENIRQFEETTSFDIVCGEKKQELTLPTIGLHNVYNALAAFAVGDLHAISFEEMAQALKHYEPSGMRQRIKKAKGITFIEDCYNASPDSQRSSLNALMLLESQRHIAVLGDMLELGEFSKKAHYDIGKYVADKNIDMLCTYGDRAKYIAQGAYDNGLNNIYTFDDKEKLGEFLIGELKEGDAVSFKASRGMKLEDAINFIYKGMGI